MNEEVEDSVNKVFQDFSEFWFYTKNLSVSQRNVLFTSLPSKEQHMLQHSYKRGGWEDLFIRNRIDNVIDGIKKEMDIDLLDIRVKALHGSCTYIKLSQWEWIYGALSRYTDKHLNYVLGNIKIEKEGDMVCLSHN